MIRLKKTCICYALQAQDYTAHHWSSMINIHLLYTSGTRVHSHITAGRYHYPSSTPPGKPGGGGVGPHQVLWRQSAYERPVIQCPSWQCCWCAFDSCCTVSAAILRCICSASLHSHCCGFVRTRCVYHILLLTVIQLQPCVTVYCLCSMFFFMLPSCTLSSWQCIPDSGVSMYMLEWAL